MPMEIEAKYRLADPDDLRRRLESLAAVGHGAVLETNRFWDWPDKTLRGGGRGLRIRRAEPLDEPGLPARITVTYKGPREPGPLKLREELEFVADDEAAVAAVLERLGLAETFLFEKRRETWSLDDCEVVVDEVPVLGWYAEIEGPSAASVAAVAARLDLADDDMEPKTYTALLRKHVAGRSIRFPV